LRTSRAKSAARTQDGFSQSDPEAIGVGKPVFVSWDDAETSADRPWTADRERRAWRCLAGRPRRREVSGLTDATDATAAPASVREQRYLVRTDAEDITQVLDVEDVHYTYEDTPTDPRCRRRVVTVFDRMGDATVGFDIACARRQAASPYPPGDAATHWSDGHDDGHRLLFFDSRPCATRRSWTTEGMGAEIYRLCDSAQTPAALIHQLSARRGADIAGQELEAAIDALLDAKVLLSLKGKLLALGVPPSLREGGRTIERAAEPGQ